MEEERRWLVEGREEERKCKGEEEGRKRKEKIMIQYIEGKKIKQGNGK